MYRRQSQRLEPPFRVYGGTATLRVKVTTPVSAHSRSGKQRQEPRDATRLSLIAMEESVPLLRGPSRQYPIRTSRLMRKSDEFNLYCGQTSSINPRPPSICLGPIQHERLVRTSAVCANVLKDAALKFVELIGRDHGITNRLIAMRIHNRSRRSSYHAPTRYLDAGVRPECSYGVTNLRSTSVGDGLVQRMSQRNTGCRLRLQSRVILTDGKPKTAHSCWQTLVDQ